MSKYILTLLVSLIAISGISQNYQCINNNSTNYFTDENQMQAIQIDSVVSEGENMVYYNFPTFAETEDPYCYTQFGPSWIGRKMKVTPEGDNIFYNMDGDSITIKTQEDTGSFWICYEFYTGYYIKATVTEIQSMTFLGITDMVKKINFQAMGSDGNPVIHPVNDMYLLLSENYGLIRTVNFKVFPDLVDNLWYDECHQFVLSGMSNPQTGIQNLTKEEVFNLNIGDEYHTDKVINSMYMGIFEQELMIYNIIDKYISTNLDTMVYQARRCGMKKELNNNVYEYLYFNDTISFTYVPHWYSKIDTIPNKHIIDDFGDYREYYYNAQYKFSNSDKWVKRNYYGLFSESPHDCVENIITDSKNPGLSENYFIEGLGGPYWHYEYYGVSYHHLLYYNKSGEEWGEPLNCDSLLLNINNFNNAKSEVRIAPNPMITQSKITFPNHKQEKHTLFIYDISGKKLREQTSTGNMIFIDKGNLSEGIYIYLLYKENQHIYSGKLIIN